MGVYSIYDHNGNFVTMFHEDAKDQAEAYVKENAEDPTRWEMKYEGRRYTYDQYRD